jgi:hypothetical protein
MLLELENQGMTWTGYVARMGFEIMQRRSH